MLDLVKSLYPYVRPHKKKASIAIFLALPLSAIKGAQVYLVEHVVNSLSPEVSSSFAFSIAGGLLVLGVLNYPCRFYHFYLMRYVVDEATCLLRSDVYQKLQKVPLQYFHDHKSGGIVSHLLNDTQILSQGFKSSIDLLREPLQALIMLGIAIYSDWQLTLVVLAVTPCFVYVFAQSGKKVRQNQEEVQEHLAVMTHDASEGIIGQKVAKAFNLQNYILSRFQKAQKIFFHYSMETTAVEENAHPLVELIGAVAFALVILFAHYRIQNHSMSTGDFFRFVAALALLMDPLRKYGQANVKVNQAMAAYARVAKLMQLPEEIDSGTKEITEFRHKIEIDRISFSYGNDGGNGEQAEKVIRDFSLTIHKGEKVAVVGPSGSGKSTLIYLLLRLYPIQSGEIRIDGIPYQELSLQNLRSLFGYVGQDIFLFHDTIRENLLLGKNFSAHEMQEALRMSCADEFVAQMPQRMETIIGDRGTKLSGGQGQRITIARAMLQNPPILLFDEATSALDQASEKVVQEALEHLAQSKTVLAVAHRLSTIKNYDKIVVMKEGEVREQGKHRDLIEQQGIYSTLYNLSWQGG